MTKSLGEHKLLAGHGRVMFQALVASTALTYGVLGIDSNQALAACAPTAAGTTTTVSCTGADTSLTRNTGDLLPGTTNLSLQLGVGPAPSTVTGSVGVSLTNGGNVTAGVNTGSSINNAAGAALTLDTGGPLTLLTTAAGTSITSGAGDAVAIGVGNSNGSKTVVLNGNLNAVAGRGMFVSSTGLLNSTTITQGLTSTIAARDAGIVGYGGTGGVTITANGAITLSGNGATNSGITGYTAGGGDVNVTLNGSINSTTGAGRGIDVLLGSFGAANVTVGAAGTINLSGGAAQSGVYVRSDGTQNIVVDGTVTTTGNGVDARIFPAGFGGINVSGAGSIASTLVKAVLATSTGGSVDINLAGTITGSTGGIEASTTGAGTSTVQTGAGLVSTTTGIGIEARTVNGLNQITVGAGGVRSGANEGVFAQATGTGNIVVNGTGNVQGGTTGVWATANTGNVSITGLGNITGTNGNGVRATSVGGNITVAPAGTVTAGTEGISASTTGAGTIAINTSGAVTAGQTGIFTQGENGLTSITTGAGGVSGTARGITASTSNTIFGPYTGGITISTGAGLVSGANAEGIQATTDGGNIGITVGSGGVRGNVGGAVSTAISATTLTGGITIATTGAVAGGAGGIQANTGATAPATAAINISTGPGAVSGGFGIFAQSTGASPVTITSSGAITATAGKAIVATGVGGNINVASTGVVTGTTGGIEATTTGAGTSTVQTGAGAVDATTAGATTVGIATTTVNGLNSVTIGTGGVGSAGSGVGAGSTGTGNVVINGTGRVNAVLAGVAGGTNTGNISITGLGPVTVTNGFIGIGGASIGGGSVTINPAGPITVSNVNSPATGTVVSVGSAEIANPGGATSGIFAATTTGAVNIATNAAISVNAQNSVGINANSGVGAVALNVGGNITASNTGILANTAGAALITIQPGVTVTGTNTAGVRTNTGIATINIGAGARITGLEGIQTQNAAIANLGNVAGTGGAGIRMANSVVTNRGSIAGSPAAAAIVNTGGASVVNNLAGGVIGGLSTTRAINNLAGSLTVNNAGVLSGFGISSAGSTTVINNQAGGAWNLGASNGFSFEGATTINNAGALNVTAAPGSTTTINAAPAVPGVQFNNQSGGVINLVNGNTNDRLVIVGNLNNAAGSAIAVDVNLAQTAAGQRGDQIQATNVTGSGVISVNRVGGAPGAFNTPIPIVLGTGSNSANFSLAGVAGAAGDNGFIAYSLIQQGNDLAVQAQLTPTAANTVTSLVSTLGTVVNSGFHQPATAIVSRPDDPKPNQIGGGPFIRVVNGRFEQNLPGQVLGTAGTALTKTDSRVDLSGFQVGFDLGVFNIQGTGWNIASGITTGLVNANTTTSVNGTASGLKAKSEIPFIGAYTIVSNGGFNAELNIRRDFYSNTLSGRDVNGSDKQNGEGTAITGGLSYRYNLGNSFYVEPSVGLSHYRVKFDSVTLGPGVVNFKPWTSLLGRAGFSTGFVWQASDNLVLQPFVSASVWHEFQGKSKANFNVGNLAFPIETGAVGTFGQVGFGIAGRLVKTNVQGFVRGDIRFGDKTNAIAGTAGLRYQF